MADSRITDLTAPTGGPASGDKVHLVDVSDTTDNANGSSKSETVGTIITTAHGLSDGVIKVASSVMTPATAETDYVTPSGSGTLANKTLTSPVINTGVSGTAILDEDNMASDSATQLATQQSIKAYVDAATGGGGNNPYGANVVIATSGGDYTTLNAYFTAGATSGDVVYVKNSHALTASITDSTTNLTIIGAGREDTTIDLTASSYILTLSGSGLTIRDLGFTTSAAGRITSIGGDRVTFKDIKFSTSGAGDTAGVISTTGEYTVIDNLHLVDTYASTTAHRRIVLDGNHFRIVNSHFQCSTNNASSYVVRNSGDDGVITGCTFDPGGAVGAGVIIYAQGPNSAVTGNVFSTFTSSQTGAMIQLGRGCAATGNVIQGGTLGIQANSDHCSITGNNIYGSSGTGYQLSGSYSTVIGNTYASGGGTATAIVVDASVDACVISGNMVDGSVGTITGISIAASTADETTIVGNGLQSCSTPISDSGTGTFRLAATDSDPLNNI